ncbi:hypothetical protein CB1_000880013 [Camelus ferus]|nr:hypothetical protein CB1_000880013 [Camelus ferus]
MSVQPAFDPCGPPCERSASLRPLRSPVVSDNPALGLLREGLKLFISHFLLKGGQVPGSAEEASVLRERAELTTRSLQGRASLRM